MKKVAILGFGTVGSGVYEMLSLNKEKIKKVCNEEIKVEYILDIRDFSERSDKDIFIKDFDIILQDKDVDIIAEVIGGIHPAYDFTKAALKAGKSVVTSNKELVAEKGDELLSIAKDMGVNYLFEASVGGGIPLINPIHNCLCSNEIEEISGILNGTTNYILTEMFEKGRSFSLALEEAQRLGYAERNPSSDVDGIDSARKIAILMAVNYGKCIDANSIYTEGISKIENIDVKYAESISSVIKLIGRGYEKDGKVYASVSPAIVSKRNQLSSVNGVFNAVSVRGNAVGDVMLYGRGAGKMPTASAVVSDICSIAQDGCNKGYYWVKAEPCEVMPFEEAEESYLVRIKEEDKDAAALIFGQASFITLSEAKGEVAFITPSMKNKDFLSKAGKLSIIKKIRVHKEGEI